MNYEQFLESKKLIVPSAGIEIDRHELNRKLFPFQADLVYWALVKGRGALFCDTGLGKTPMQLAWAEIVHRHTGRDVLILAPLAVARQTVQEGSKFGIAVNLCRTQDDVEPGINITNYEMVDHFEADKFVAVVLDESSLLKNFEGKTRTKLIAKFARTGYKLCCTATPAPNDIQEICNHAEFLGIMTRTEMLAAFFVHDDNGWRLKGHAKKGPFWEWLASWSMAVKKPSDLGYSDDGYNLPGLDIQPVYVRSDFIPEGKLFIDKLNGITERTQVRKATIAERVEATINLIKKGQ